MSQVALDTDASQTPNGKKTDVRTLGNMRDLKGKWKEELLDRDKQLRGAFTLELWHCTTAGQSTGFMSDCLSKTS